MRIAYLVKTDVDGIDVESVVSLLNPSPVNSFEDLSQSCIYFPFNLSFFL